MATLSRSRVSSRAQRFWERLISWYGSRLTEQYGAEPKGDWCELIDDHENEVIAAALAEIKIKHPQYPPSFPEADAIFARLKAPSQAQIGPSMLEQLSDFVHRNRTLTANQLRLPWKYLGRTFDAPGIDGKTRAHHGVQMASCRSDAYRRREVLHPLQEFQARDGVREASRLVS
jgi:hypothetical protein